MKIDVAKIEGYETMTAEEKLAALEQYEFEDNSADVGKLKNLLNKANSEAADYKHKLQEKMSADERKEAERLETEKAMKEKLAALEEEKTISTFKASYLSLGYPEELATSSAEAMAKGDMATVFANQKTHNDTQKSATIAEMLKNQPALSVGKTPEIDPNAAAVAAFRRGAGL